MKGKGLTVSDAKEATEGIRLQKVLSQAGIASRRAAEQMIVDGRIEVNGRLVTELGTRVFPDRDQIRVDGSRIPPPRRHVYLLVNKPRGVVSTMDDPQGRATLEEFQPRNTRLFHVGRLDTETDGLILMTNDGEFANRMSHPAHEVPKTYLAEVEGIVTEKEVQRLLKGLTLEDGFIRADAAKVVNRVDGPPRSLLRITIHSGRNRIVRRMCDAIAHPVRELSRISIGPVRLGRLPVGESRELTREELGELFDMVGL